MRGIERVITGILLTVAVCGSAAFARGIGRETAGADEMQLAAAPPQHAQSSRGVQVPLYPLLTDRPEATPAAATPSLADAPVPWSAPAPAQRVVVARPSFSWRSPAPPTHASRSKPVPATSRQAPTPPAPTQPAQTQPTPTQPAPATPTPPQRQPASRILAEVPLTPEHRKGVGHGRLKNHPDDDTAVAPTQQQQPQQQPSGPLTPQPTGPTSTIVVLSPAPQASNGNGHGHAYGHLKQDVNDHD